MEDDPKQDETQPKNQSASQSLTTILVGLKGCLAAVT
jgi:hypothetical protein